MKIPITYSRNAAKKVKDASAGKSDGRRTREARAAISTTASLLFFFAIVLALIFISKPAISENAQLNSAIQNVSSQTTTLGGAVATLSQDENILIQKYHLTNAGQCSLWVTSVSTGPIVVNFIPSASTITAVQADLILSSSFTITGATLGSAGTIAGKSVQFSKAGSAWRVLIFGLNTTPIGAGTLASLSFSSLAGTPKGTYPIYLTNLAASDPSGNTSLLCGTSGAVKL